MARPPGPQPVRRTVPLRFAVEISMVWCALVRALRDPYRPERFYMRGPGPRWRAKNGLAPV